MGLLGVPPAPPEHPGEHSRYLLPRRRTPRKVRRVGNALAAREQLIGSNRSRNVCAVSLAADREVVDPGWWEREHEEEYRRTKGELSSTTRRLLPGLYPPVVAGRSE